MDEKKIKIIECPRDAMQGWKEFIPTKKKIEYLDSLLQVGFDTIDFGSFVSSKAIPQMSDTKEVLKGLGARIGKTKLLAIIANVRGAEEASIFEQVDFLGFPFSVSETFQQRNTNSSILESLKRLESIQAICLKTGKTLVVYLSMGFGNPYGDPYSEEIVIGWAKKVSEIGINIISLADTVGLAVPAQVYSTTGFMVSEFPGVEIGVHLHSKPVNWREKLDAAYRAGCRRFDGAIKGIGGCPMANDELVGNMNTELMLSFFREKRLLVEIDDQAFGEAVRLADQVFGYN